MTIRMHKKVKITVLRTEYDQELAEQYAIPNLGMCSRCCAMMQTLQKPYKDLKLRVGCPAIYLAH